MLPEPVREPSRDEEVPAGNGVADLALVHGGERGGRDGPQIGQTCAPAACLEGEPADISVVSDADAFAGLAVPGEVDEPGPEAKAGSRISAGPAARDEAHVRRQRAGIRSGRRTSVDELHRKQDRRQNATRRGSTAV